MKQYLILVVIILIQCKSSENWTSLNDETCSKYAYGKLEARHLLSDPEKALLLKHSIRIHEFIIDNYYMGSWPKNFKMQQLSQLPIKSLYPSENADKLAGGITEQMLFDMAVTPGESMVLLQTIGPVQKEDVERFGKLLFEKDNFYRMNVNHQNLKKLLDFPCLRMMSILKENNEPESSENEKE
ncbi:MAG: hypothetical protein M3Q56_07030 [Bacteroidota bacterium]|nr:hypothetical protein [Bacteroidota bacterium]